MVDKSGWIALSYSLGYFLLVSVAVFALVLAWKWRARILKNQESFITARGQAPFWRISWSFFAGALGAWVVVSPASFSPYTGAVGMTMYAIASGVPIIMIAFAGAYIQRKVPHVLSLADFIGWRFGWVAKTYVMLFVVFNMSIAMLAEYSTIGSLFQDYLGASEWSVILLIVAVGLLTMTYTSQGGVLVSLVTDQVQGIFVVLLFFILWIYMAATFRYPLPPMSCDSENPPYFCISGNNGGGWGTIFSMPASLAMATIFSEAMWQRVWASKSDKALYWGSGLACCMIIIVVFFFGLCGWLAAWAGLITENTNPNLYFLQALKGAVNSDGQMGNWIGLVTLLCAVVMNESAVDSMQTGLVGNISSHLLRGYPLIVTRLCVVVINIPLIYLGTRRYSVLQLFLLANMLCSTAGMPVLIGLIDPLHPYVGGGSFIFSCVTTIILTSIFGCADHWDSTLSSSQNVSDGMHFTWMGNNYNWKYLLVPICVSIGLMFLCAGVNFVLLRWIKIWKRPAVKGFIAPATHPDLICLAGTDESDESSEDLKKGAPAEAAEGAAEVAQPPVQRKVMPLEKEEIPLGVLRVP